MFEVGLADDSRTAMRRSLVVWRVEPVESKNTLATLSKMLSGCAAHSAEAQNDDVEAHLGVQTTKRV